jgi:hypothetical protein
VVAYGACRPKPRLDLGEGCGFGLEMRGGKNGGGHGCNLPLAVRYVKCNVAASDAP